MINTIFISSFLYIAVGYILFLVQVRVSRYPETDGLSALAAALFWPVILTFAILAEANEWIVDRIQRMGR